MLKNGFCNKCNIEVHKEWLFCPHCGSNILLHTDTARISIQTHLEGNVIPFYEKFINQLKVPFYLGGMLFCLPFLAFHIFLGMLFKVDTLTDWSWILSLLMGYTFILLVWNTQHLRKLTLNLFHFNESEIERFHTTIIKQLEGILSNKRLLGYGFFFGGINTSFGVIYGIWYVNSYLVASIMLQFFVEGFICGMAVCGIVGVVKLISTFSGQNEIAINYRDPDKCGGISKIGNTLLQFSITTLSVGVLISLYIYLSPWTHRAQPIVKYSIYGWMAFPHFAAISVLLLPMLKLHHMLEKFKTLYDRLISRQCGSIRNELISKLMHSTDPKDFLHYIFAVIHYNQMTDLHSKVNNLCTWPFDSRSGLIYIVSFFVTSLVPITQLIQLAHTYQNILK